jgi:hypothetical protein
MIEGVIASLVAAGIAAAIAFLYRRGYLHVLIEETMFQIAPSGMPERRLLPKETTALQAHLVRWLLHDQSRFGHHRGQYGKSCDALHSQKWQAAAAVIVIAAGAMKTALLAGLVILTVGGVFATTVTATALEVAVAPRLSVARAV